MLEVCGYIAAVLMGLILGVIGGGGSILTVPILVYLMDTPPQVATGYSLLIVGATAAFGAFRYFKEGLIDVKTALTFAIPSIISVFVARAFIMPAIPDVLVTSPILVAKDAMIMVLFAVLMVASATMMLRKAYAANDSAENKDTSKNHSLGLIAAEGALVGVVTGILGAGGGFLIIPALVLFAGMSMQRAVGASLFIIALKSLIGFVGDIQNGIEISLPLLPLMLLATFAGMTMSSMLAGRLSESFLQKFFAIFTLLIAAFIIAKETM